MRLLTLTALLMAGTTAQANINVRFLEGAPKDRFIIENAGDCDMGPFDVTLDLSQSQAGLIFDVTGAGAGVEVFQPLEIVEGSIHLASVVAPKDGDNVLSLPLNGLPANARVAFTIDVDDTLKNGPSGQIIVRGSEFAGAAVKLSQDGRSTMAQFGDTPRLGVSIDNCTVG